MLRQVNCYCSACLRTQRFVSLADRLVCQVCSKRLWRRTPLTERPREEPVERPRVSRMPLDAVI